MTREEITKFEEECREKINAMWFELLEQEYPVGTTFEMEGKKYLIRGFSVSEDETYYARVVEIDVQERYIPIPKLPKLKGETP